MGKEPILIPVAFMLLRACTGIAKLMLFERASRPLVI